ncbi:polar amino acid transport system substrate-binding protein [Neorhizobium galegae]|uniref:transporter substrate-binding domain-containing protein n=1 Tax=Neorhizobium galegae TaxID=399 RepID=UPI00278AA186|nr:transporter substrate-binding domain-containing protein [Neorhizobium galegae]MDQ0137711.1 polar amino acid transport system substrate-binding protein [Neorhizobium galegae]
MTMPFIGKLAFMVAVGAAAVSNAQEITTIGTLNPKAPLYNAAPDALKSAGFVKVGTTTDAPPYQFYEAGTRQLRGINPDLLATISTLTGIPFRVETTAFPAVLPGLQAGQFDMAIGPFGQNPERLQVVNFVNFLNVGQLFAGRADANFTIESFDDACGRKVAEFQGDTNLALMQKQAEKCKAEGRPELALSIYKDNTGQWQGLLSGRDELIVSNSPTVRNKVALSGGQAKVVSKPLGTSQYIGWFVPKGNQFLTGYLASAFAASISDGSYNAALGKWNVTDDGLKEARVNGEPVSSK